jgi:hypothetical protein
MRRVIKVEKAAPEPRLSRWLLVGLLMRDKFNSQRRNESRKYIDQSHFNT